MTADAKPKSKPAKKRKADPPNASKYQPDDRKDTKNAKSRKVTGEKSKKKSRLEPTNDDSSETLELDDKTMKLIVAGTASVNLLILSVAITLFILSGSCGDTVASGSQGSGSPYPGSSPGSSATSGSGPPSGQGFGSPYPGGSPGSTGGSGSGSSGYAPGSSVPGNSYGQPGQTPGNTHSSSSSSPNPPPSGSSGQTSQEPILTEFDVINNPNHQCGVTEIQPDLQRGRIVGGAEAIPNSWPFTVGVGVLEILGGSQVSIMQMCGGTLISPRHALTAAHCFKGDPYGRNPYSVFAGVHSTQTYEGLHPMRVAAVRIHPKTNAFTENPWVVYDFALLTLYKEFTPDAKMQIACLPTLKKVLPEGTICWATGWGKTQGTGAENLLKQVAIDVVSEQTCQMKYNPDIVMKSTLCGGTTPGQDTCQGDSGGPLYHKDDGKWTVYGVTSYGAEVCGSGPMAAYGTVSYNLEWICCFMASIPACAGIRCNNSGEN